ncbi:MAG: hypothetical protein M3362_06895 [Acidobacteriota bacterium]|nr:hypothetical protein [Acidobacteriota bacterium]
MSTIRCGSCSLLNFDTAEVCKRCGALLNQAAATEQDSFQPAYAGNYQQPASGESQLWERPSYRPDYLPQPPVKTGAGSSRLLRIFISLVVTCIVAAFGIPKLLRTSPTDFSKLSWSDYQSQDGKFSVSFPAAAKEQTRVVPSALGDAQAHYFEGELGKDSRCALMYADYPIEHINMTEESLYDMALKGASASQNIWAVGARRYITLGRYRGIEAELKPTDSRATLTGHVRIFWVSPRLYVVLIAGPDKPEFKAVETRYLDSFRLP